MSSKRILYVIRHAKSSWDYEGVADLDRPLKYRGISNAYEMARRLKINRDHPDFIISSPAIRALHTAMIFKKVFNLPDKHLIINSALYSCGPDEILDVIKSQDAAIKRIMIFGHNPDFSELVSHLTKKIHLDLPTCGMARLEFDAGDWNSISLENVKSEHVDFPKKE